MNHAQIPDTYASELLEASAPGITSFYLMREQPSGGFSAGRYMPATLEDTYHAIRCLKLLGHYETADTCRWQYPGMVPIDAHREFLEARLRQDWNHSRRLFHILFCLTAIESLTPGNTSPGYSPQSVMEFLMARIRTMPALDECFYAIRTCHLLNHDTAMALDNLPPLTDYSIKSLSELRMLLYLIRHSAAQAEVAGISRQWLPWLKRCMNYDGGYGFFPGTTSYIENVYHAMGSYSLMGEEPGEARKSVGFIRACRSARGGFGRRSQGIPFPDSTWYATASLVFLSGYNPEG